MADHAAGLQFFIVKGGGEGFLDGSYAGKDASRMIVLGGSTTASSTAPMTFVFDDNDLLIAFDKAGKIRQFGAPAPTFVDRQRRAHRLDRRHRQQSV